MTLRSQEATVHRGSTPIGSHSPLTRGTNADTEGSPHQLAEGTGSGNFRQLSAYDRLFLYHFVSDLLLCSIAFLIFTDQIYHIIFAAAVQDSLLSKIKNRRSEDRLSV